MILNCLSRSRLPRCSLLSARQAAHKYAVSVTEKIMNGLYFKSCLLNKASHIFGMIHLAVAVGDSREI